jgi:hypothetical protein
VSAKWIRFEKRPTTPGYKTDIWHVVATQGDGYLGTVKWWGGWRRYCFFPADGSLYEQDCLRDIADFCETETRNYKAAKVLA